jgi:dynein heavy chain
MSPVGAQFRDKLRMFPSLVNCMTIDWFTAWPRDALLSVAQRLLAKLDVGSETVKKGVCEIAVHMHMTVKQQSEDMFASLRRRNYTTPTSYLSLLALYQEVYEEQNKAIGDNVKRYKNGLDKLDSTNATIEELKKRIREMQPVLAKASKEADEQQAQLVIDQAEADQVKQEVSTEEASARALMADAEAIKKECEDGLAEALPALAAAEKALQTLSQKDIGEIKTFTTPPTNVEKTMNAVLILLKEKDGWATAKQCLSKMDFLSRLTGYNRDDIAPAIIRKLTPFIQDKEFVPDVIEKTSLPCRSMCMWVHAMYKYYHVAREIAPKRERLRDAEGKVADARALLEVKQARLKQVIEKVQALQKAAKDTAERKASLESQIVEAEAKLGRADQLIGGLSSERIRWEQSLQTLKAQKHNVVGTMALAAGCVAYLGPFPSTYRVTLVKDWTARAKALNIPCDEGFSLDRLPDQYTVREWAIQSLPQDPFSIENATVLQRSKRWCLMIDPQGQANTFIRKKEGANKLKVIKLTDDNYMRSVESAIQVGHPVLLENVGETLDAALDPVLLKQPVRLGGRLVLKLGEKEVDYDPTFRFYITTKMPNPLFSPELQIKVTIVNFTVTRKGLEDQLLSDIVGFERSDLQEKSDQCVVAIAKGKAEIKGLEDAILKNLAESTGDILDNIELIATLSASKKTSDAISKDLEVVERTNAEIDAAREEYRVLATRGSLVYGVVADLAVIDPMYQYSLKFFKLLFLTTLERTARVGPTDENPECVSESVQERVAKLIPAVTWTSYSVICRGLFEKDKLLFSFMLSMMIVRHSGIVSDAEWIQFIRGNAGQKLPGNYTAERPQWLESIPWADFVSLCTNFPDKLQYVLDHFAGNQDAWRQWILSENLYESHPPCPPLAGGAPLSEWHRAMIVKTLRPEKLNFTMARVVTDFLGKEFSISPQFSLREAFNDSTNMTPLIFVLSTGTDPTVLFTTFAEEMGYKDKKLMLSLGQDQGKRAAQMIEEGKKEGLWVYLQNCHVYVSWMPALERLVEQFKPEDIHPDFRLWLTSNPSPAFPVPVLQSGMKLTREPPKGLKANLKDSVHSLDAAIWSEQDGQPKERQWKKLVFALTFFHALVQERRKFGALGWNIAYEWSAPDLSASVKTLRIAINDFDEIPWSAILYTIGVLNYGGRVTDFLDNRCLQAVAQQFFRVQLFNSDCKFDTEGLYYPPEPCTKDELLGYVEALPQYEAPTLFGLHTNANISFQAKESNAVMATLIEMQPRGGSGGGGGKTPDQVVSEVADDLLQRCPEIVDPEKAHPSSFAITANGTMISLGTVLSQEIEQFNRLLRVTRSSLLELKRAIKGEVVMSATMEMMYTSLTFNKVPENWKKVGYLCLKPLASYYSDLIERIKFIASWCYDGAPLSFWLPGLFFPQGFITGVFQTHSRKHKMSIDSIKFRFHFCNGNPSTPPESGVYTHGYFLEGASWADGKLCESRPGILYTPLPTIHLDPIPLADKDPPSVYECPLYKASTRAGVLSTTGLSTNFVLTMQLPSPTEFTADHWISRGVAALCMLDT